MLKLNTEAVKSILDRVTIGTTGRADGHDPTVAVANERVHKQVKKLQFKHRPLTCM